MMKGRLNLDYERSPDPYDRHRALYMYRPTTEMTGDYTCKVSTLQNDVTATKRMTVFGKKDIFIYLHFLTDKNQLTIFESISQLLTVPGLGNKLFIL